MKGVQATIENNMLEEGGNKTYRDLRLGHSLEGMDRHYIKPSEETLPRAMAQCIAWLDEQLANVDQTVDQEAITNA
jgi:hypothetical protein